MNLYEILGIDKTASMKDVVVAYRKLAQEWHPDRNDSEEAKERFQDIAIAYKVLKNPDSRKEYDETGNYGEAETLDAKAAEGIIAMFTQLATQREFEPTNYVTLIGQQIIGNKAEIKQKLRQAKQLKEKIVKISESIDGPEDNIFWMAIDQQVTQLDNSIKNLNDQERQLEKAGEILEGYKGTDVVERGVQGFSALGGLGGLGGGTGGQRF